MWDQRYNQAEYAYGTQPNDFLRANYHHLPKGKILSLAEGEGRNAVFLAQHGYEVTAVDSSLVGLEKAQQLAQENGVHIHTIHADLSTFEIEPNHWDGIISIFFPMIRSERQQLYPKIIAGLKQHGVFLIEAYRPEQIAFGTGGGKSVETMTSQASLEQDLAGLSFLGLQSIDREVIEGQFHTGMGAVLQAIAIKSEI
ncbi:methyltransferase family protein [Acinetobacter calcoaceticus]|uniref:Methyltransferase family protein n=1 Tax=Acinetobacter calcoaceticus TaxID=471 RepID=A0A4R1Y8D2_ACICA|nr:methyltransferase family protein [Acinetobacter calcoaceticus]